MSKPVHTYLFMEVPNLSAFSDEFRDDDKPGFVAVCNETGAMVGVDEDDGWSGWPNAPKGELKRIPFALGKFCHTEHAADFAIHIQGE